MIRTAKLVLLLLVLAFTLPSFADNLLNDGSFETPVVPSNSTCGAFGAPGSAECFHTYPAYSNSNIGPWYVIGKSDVTCDMGGCVPNGAPAPIMLMTNSYTEPYYVGGVQTGTLSFTAQDGTQAIDLTGEGNQGENGIKQSLTLSPGTYDLSFYLGHQDSGADGYAGASSLSLWLDGAEQQVFTNGDVNVANNVTWNLEHFTFSTAGYTTIAFINQTPTGNNYAGLDNVVLTQTPEPASLLLLGSGLVGLFGWRARKLR